MELLKSVNRNHMCAVCNESNLNCTGCNYSVARHNHLLYKKAIKLIKEKEIKVPMLMNFDRR